MKQSTPVVDCADSETSHLSSLIKEDIFQLCQQELGNQVAQIEIDCLVGITLHSEVQKQIIVKINEVFNLGEEHAVQNTEVLAENDFEEAVDLIVKRDDGSCGETNLDKTSTDRDFSPLSLRKPQEGESDTKHQLTCKICSVQCSGGVNSMLAHINKVHNRFACRYCFSTFTMPSSLRKHEQDHQNLKTHKCKVCFQKFFQESELQHHVTSHHQVLLPCPKCPQMFNEVPCLRWHLTRVHQELNTGYCCAACEMMFADRHELEEHLLQPHHGFKTAMLPKAVVGNGLTLSDSFNTNSLATQASTKAQIPVTKLVLSQESPSPKDESCVKTSHANLAGSRKRKSLCPSKHVVGHLNTDEELDLLYFNPPSSQFKSGNATKVPKLEKSTVADFNSAILSGPIDYSFKKKETPPLIYPNKGDQESEKKAADRNSIYHISKLTSVGNLFLPISYDGSLQHVGRSTIPSHLPMIISPDTKGPIRPSFVKANQRRSNLENGDLTDHKTQSPLIEEYLCSEADCQEICLSFSLYEDHCMTRHGRYPCKYCKQTFSGKNNRTRHMRCHIGSKTYTCPDCNKNFSRPDSMREHQFIHTLSYQEDKCRNCGASFDKKNLLLAHLKQCYRHKMETGKSTKLIDETPTYDFKQELPIQLESRPFFEHSRIPPMLEVFNPSSKPLTSLSHKWGSYGQLIISTNSMLPSSTVSSSTSTVTQSQELASATTNGSSLDDSTSLVMTNASNLDDSTLLVIKEEPNSDESLVKDEKNNIIDNNEKPLKDEKPVSDEPPTSLPVSHANEQSPCSDNLLIDIQPAQQKECVNQANVDQNANKSS